MTVGDVTSTERGSGARFNDGKPALELIPLELVGTEALRERQLMLAHEIAAAEALIAIGQFQTRQRGVEALYDALALLDGDFELWNECARVFTYGAKKYAAWNWAKGMAWSVPIACAARHLLKVLKGEALDDESGLPHRGHVACNIVMLLTFVQTFPEGDDRMPESIFNPPPPAPVGHDLVFPNKPVIPVHLLADYYSGMKTPTGQVTYGDVEEGGANYSAFGSYPPYNFNF